ncbi:peptidylprolyl isomerase [Novosphingobium lubricantis]
MDLAPDAAARPRRVVIQLLPAPFSQGWIGNIRTLAAAHWWDGTSINRAQDNYVVQWGDPEGENPGLAKPLPPGLQAVPQSAYGVRAGSGDRTVSPEELDVWLATIEATHATWHALSRKTDASKDADPYADDTFFFRGWPIAASRKGPSAWPVHCYGSVGVGRDYPPDTGSGAELYAVIGHAPRQLDRNIAVVGRVIEGIAHLSTLPRGTADLGFYATPGERVPILSIRMGDAVPGLPAYQYLSTESTTFHRYADAVANRRDRFFIQPAGGADICNVKVPVRRVP